MYKNYPIVILMLYCEQNNSNEATLELIKRIQAILKKRNDFFTKNHLLTHLIIDSTQDGRGKTFEIIPNNHSCIDLIHYCCGYSINKLFSKAFIEHQKMISGIISDETLISPMPTEIISIQYESSINQIPDEMFKNIKHLARLNKFFFSTTKTEKNSGDYDRLDRYLCDFLDEISHNIAKRVEGINDSIDIPYQKNFYLY